MKKYRSNWMTFIFLTVIFLLFGNLAPTAAGNEPPSIEDNIPDTIPGGVVYLHYDTNQYELKIPPPQAFLQRHSQPRLQSTTINVEFVPDGGTDGFYTCSAPPLEAVNSFEYAAAIWETLIDSSVPIVVQSCWATNLPTGVLGYGGVPTLHANFEGALITNTYYPPALANKLSGVDLNGNTVEIRTGYNTDTNWYFGTDGNTPSGQLDFVSVVLHEIAHGLGFAGSMNYNTNNGEGSYRTPYPIAYDRFAYDAQSGGSGLLSYANPSISLGNVLTSNDVWWDGMLASRANGGDRAKLYAPATWRQGSSYSHLDYQTYAGGINALMVYAIGSGVAIHDPGPVTMGLLGDMGWSLPKIWVGNTDDWHTASNWSDGVVPRDRDDIIIPASPTGGNHPDIDQDAQARHMLIQDGATITMTNGTLEIYGYWEEEGTGIFNGTGGTVAFKANFPQIVVQNADSSFNDVEIGDGASLTTVTLNSNLSINGDLVIHEEAILTGETHTIYVGGNWTEHGTFIYGTSHVIFDGAAQDINKTNIDSVPISEDFNSYTNNGYTTASPSGWLQTRPNEGTFDIAWAGTGTTYGGSIVRNFQLTATGTDGWLFTPAVSLSPGVQYELEYQYQTYLSGNHIYSTFYGNSQSPAVMLDDGVSINTFAVDGPNGSRETSTTSFTVDEAGTYYIGFRLQGEADNRSLIDDIVLRGTAFLNFYDLQISSTILATFHAGTWGHNNLVVSENSKLDINGQRLAVEGAVTNNGSLRDTLYTPSAITTHFLHIQNIANDEDKYSGVEITPASNSMGETTVEIRGNQDCTTDNTSQPVQRCFDIDPQTHQSATIRFYYLPSEANGNPENGVNVYHWNGATEAWDLETGTHTHSMGGDPRWVQVTDVSDYSPFVLDNQTPTAVSLANIGVNTAVPTGLLLILLVVVGTAVGLLTSRRRSTT